MANVKVAVRARPLLPREVEMKSPVIVEMRDNATIISKVESGVAVGDLRDASKEFTYDHSYWSVYDTDHNFASQEQIFGDLGKSVLESAFNGYNACIFAYGQTGSGKTYTMMGSKDSPGLIPRICAGLFTGMNEKKGEKISYKVDVSYMEIYNEKVRDLLRVAPPAKTTVSPQGGNTLHNLKVREHPKTGPYVENLMKHQVCDYESIQHLISTGNDQRVTAATKMNDVSSRSHAIFTILFNQAKYSSGLPSETVSKIHLVDLAGSERASQTGAEGIRLKEGGNINKSLVCLGNVISALADRSGSAQANKGKLRYIPYRDSTLTWLLKDSLGGNSKTIMVATLSPCEYSYSETMSTLRYASRAKNIVNKPTVNEDPNVKVIRDLRNEIKRLKQIINSGDLKGATPESSLLFAVDLHNKEEQINKMTKVWAEKWEGLQKIIEEREVELQSDGVKVTFASEQPHLLGVDEDMFSAGVVLYYLKTGDTNIGKDPSNDIVLKSDDIADRHCVIVSIDDSACLHRVDGDCIVNQDPVQEDTPTVLSHGDTLCFGSRHYFRFNNPQEAKKLREMPTDHNKSNSSNGSALWNSPVNPHRDKLSKLERERDALREQQLQIETEYEEKIKKVLEQLESERENKAALEEELGRLREKKLTASMRIATASFSASTPIPEVVQSPDQSLMPSLLPSSMAPPTPLSSESESSMLDFDENFERQVIGEEGGESTPVTSKRALPRMEQYPDNSFTRGRSNSVLEYSVSLNDGGDYLVQAIDPDKRVVEGQQGDEDYLMLETDSSSSSQDNDRGVTDTMKRKNEVFMVKQQAETEKDRLKACYEERLQEETKQKEKLQKEILDLELQLQLGSKDAKIPRRRSDAIVGDEGYNSSFTRGKPSYHSHRTSSVKVEIPAYYLRGQGWSSYHVYEIHITVKGKEGWRVFRKFEQFRDFHEEMKMKYPEITSLVFPPSKWIGYKTDTFVTSRKVLLERYLKNFIAIMTASSSSILSETSTEPVTVETVQKFHSFFRPGPLQAAGVPPPGSTITRSQQVSSPFHRS